MDEFDKLRKSIEQANYADVYRVLESLVNGKKTAWYDLQICQIALEYLIKHKKINVSIDNNSSKHFFNNSIFQFWDSKLIPDDVLSLLDEWKSINLNNTYSLFDDESARYFVLENFSDDVVAAYDLAYHPAMKADLFRLCYTYITGSLYIDADEKCLQPVSIWLPSDLDFFSSFEVVNGNYSIGNKFFYAVKGSPIVRKSIEVAVSEIHSCASNNTRPNIWLTTGPGNLTRSYIDIYFDSKKVKSLLMADNELESYVKWMSLNYQNTRLNWRNSSS